MRSKAKSKGIIFFIIIVCMVVIGMAGETLSAAKDFPNKPIKWYVGWGGGGGNAMMARVISQGAGEILGRPIVVIPKPGAGGTICITVVSKAKPDGYTLTTVTQSSLATAHLHREISYTLDSFEYLAQFARIPLILFVSSKSPWKTLEEVIAYAKEHPRELKYPSTGTGSSSHVAMEMICADTGTKMVNVPMKSGPEMLLAILGGHCQVSAGYMTTITPAKEGGRIRLLATSAEQRIKEFPDLPTFVEKGFPSIVFNSWYGVVAPKGLPKTVSDKLKDVFAEAIQDKNMQKMLGKLGVHPEYKSGDEFARFVRSEQKRLVPIYIKVFKKVGIPLRK